MQAYRTFARVKDQRVLIELPSDFEGCRVEIIVLIDESSLSPVERRQVPGATGKSEQKGKPVRRVAQVSTGGTS